jgi:hypothetical protein
VSDGVTLDTRSGKVTVNGAPVDLSAHEYRVLRYLMHHKGQAVSRSELIEQRPSRWSRIPTRSFNATRRSSPGGRVQAGNLAHGLKTPLSILANEVDRLTGDGAPSWPGRCEARSPRCDSRSITTWPGRAAASIDVPGARVPVAPSVAGIQRTLARLYVGRDLQFAIDIPADHVFRGEQQDLEEMLGNLGSSPRRGHQPPRGWPPDHRNRGRRTRVAGGAPRIRSSAGRAVR